ncbi:AEC family transporter [uncultured Shimia sp.]|mgnify:CR=1 FL=1|uniref:AEC family transporter n=1 Tax=uncultured Shimia sp. TaxID=573152 RepID=UPI0025D388F4|nr:AEC family transporter [uncultured Shimia sp.]
MNIILTVLEIVAPVFLVAGVGFAWVKAGFEYRIQFVTRLAMTLAVPCLIFTALMKTEANLADLAKLTLAGTTAYVVVGAVGWGLLKATGLSLRTYLAPIIFGNTGNLGIPLALFAFGQPGLEAAVVMLAVSAILSFTWGIWIVAGEGAFSKMIKEPMIWATLLGALFLVMDWETPKFLTNTLDLIGQMAIPMMLLTLGVAVARLTPGRVVTAIWLSVVKLLICAAIGWGIGLVFGLTGTLFGVLVLQMAMPVAVTAYLLAEKYEADSNAVAGYVVVSTLVSVIGLPILLALLL